MTDTPKVRFNNSILKDIKDEKADDKAAEAKVKADVNGGTPDNGGTPETTDPAKVAKAIKAAAKDAPNPNAAPADPKTDPAAVAAAANKMEDSSAKKAEKSDKAPAAALAQMRDVNGDPTKIDSVRGPSDGAPIGFGVHKLAIAGGNPYAAKQMYRSEEPVPNLQHQPVILQPGVVAAAPAAPKLGEQE
jgi:hypothetical protein